MIETEIICFITDKAYLAWIIKILLFLDGFPFIIEDSRIKHYLAFQSALFYKNIFQLKIIFSVERKSLWSETFLWFWKGIVFKRILSCQSSFYNKQQCDQNIGKKSPKIPKIPKCLYQSSIIKPKISFNKHVIKLPI